MNGGRKIGDGDGGEGAAAEGIVADALQALGEGDRGDNDPLAVTAMFVPRYYLSVDEEFVPICSAPPPSSIVC